MNFFMFISATLIIIASESGMHHCPCFGYTELMQINDLFILLMLALLGLYFLRTGLSGLSGGPVKVVDPDNPGAWPGPLGFVLHRLRRDAGINSSGEQRNGHVELKGKEARPRAWFYTILGAAILALGVLYLINVALERQS
jgi:hypothetical protein